jgi:hypothetical protein
MEIIINGKDLPAISRATQAAIADSVNTPGLLRISAGNYGGRLGKSFIYLHPDKQPAAATESASPAGNRGPHFLAKVAANAAP